MALEQEADRKQEPSWAAFVALDWADRKHDWLLNACGSKKREAGVVENTPEALENWAMNLYHRFQGKPIAVCLEQSRGSLVYRLMKYSHLILYPVNTTTISGFRQAFAPSGSKSDPADTSFLMDVLLHHRDRLRPLEPDTVETRKLQLLVEERRRLVNEKTRLSNRLTMWMKMYFPQMLDWVDDIDSPLGCALLQRWPTLESLQRVKPEALRDFFHQYNCRSQARIEERIAGIGCAKPAVDDAALLAAGPLTVKAIVAQVQVLLDSISEFDRAIEAEVVRHEDASLFENLPGAGKVLVPRLVVAFGTNRGRWDDARALQSFSGIAPVTSMSGNTKVVHFRWACPKFLRQTFHEFAAHSIPRCPWASAFYRDKLEHGMTHHAAVRALAFKWIRILFRCWKTRTPYDESTYLQSLNKRRSPLATLVEWQSVAGFQKLSAKKA
jgi:transposase